ncbi:unnamed protein product [Candidula unifasciata]|uniref:Profilin n=1 Tax=Candidula unifasciata TaxID=100452 RepID=A0A8S3ZL14_9EUPU|nr:unnamed protein product [Candidula unifasciata]
MLELMSWSEIIDNLKQEGQLKLAAVFDLSGNKIANTGETLITSEDAVFILKSLDNVTTVIFGLVLLGSTYVCISVDANTLIGQAKEEIFVARRNRNLMICAVSNPKSNISCLATVKKFMDKFK